MKLDVRIDDNDPTRMALLLDGTFIAFLPWRTADDVIRVIAGAARKCEEYEKANSIIIADSLLIRTGAPFALSNNPKIRDAAYNEAQWGDSRKRMPLASVPSARACGTPTFRKHRVIGGKKP